ncbi:MAG: 2-C-methyl-D-erythritol 2,4-cyclodiphosphate synthase [Nitrospirota bacterium]|jgi:2-C-methyl-D-erythritol 2,4-cyclodiphosphate synthase
MIRAGIGYDVHSFSKGRRLFIGGIEIPHEKGLSGHSDADVLLHAICDAILGAAAKGDIGRHFPNTDPAFKDISSLELLKRCVNIVRADGYDITNIDSVIIAEEPMFALYMDRMIDKISEAADISKTMVNIKATTNEKMGFIGKGEGIAAYAVCILQKMTAS